jgi:dipeptidase D
VRDWARSKGFEVVADGVGNLVVRVPATKGREKAPVVVIQGHLDMVCERNADSAHDAERGDINVVRDGDWLRAEGTTLGADNGIGVASGMAAAEDPAVKHGPLELLCTIDEETGMTGAQGLDGKLLRGRLMLNLDSEEDDVLFVGCAGGGDVKITFGAARRAAPADHDAFVVSVKGLQGGHSGLDINRNRMNALRALARVIQDGAKKAPVMISSVAGGSKRNAIPREARATVLVPAGGVAAFKSGVEASAKALAQQFKGLDDGLQVGVESAGGASDVFDAADSHRLLDLLRAIPTGVITMSQDIPGLVESSTNLGVATTAGDKVEILCLCRSSNMPALADVLDAHFALARLAGTQMDYLGGYPGWKPDLSSKALAATKAAYTRLFGAEPGITAIHAGLECGLIGERAPGMDMVSFGPHLVGVHAPGEKVSIPSTQKFWKLLSAVLDDLSTA